VLYVVLGMMQVHLIDTRLAHVVCCTLRVASSSLIVLAHVQDGTAKMSKSAENDKSRINMIDDPSVITKKIKSAKTDSGTGLVWDDPDRPECQNLLSIYAIVTGKSKDDIGEEVRDMSWGTFKPLLAEAVVEHLKPYQDVYQEVMADPGELDRVLKAGADAANEVASVTVERVRDAMGFLPPL
jgi:tryptophanyl-tRNA synthetase